MPVKGPLRHWAVGPDPHSALSGCKHSLCCWVLQEGQDGREKTSHPPQLARVGSAILSPVEAPGPEQCEADSSNNWMFTQGLEPTSSFTASPCGGGSRRSLSPQEPWCPGNIPDQMTQAVCYHQALALFLASVPDPRTQLDTPSACSIFVELQNQSSATSTAGNLSSHYKG